MKLLILGGTQFLGRHLLEAALAAGHDVTLFNRGMTNPDLYPDVPRLKGDRKTGDYESLKGTSWDAVIDTCGYVPRQVRQTLEALDGNVGHYTFISSVSVHPDLSEVGINEDSPLGTLDDPDTEEITGESYGPLKVACEQAAQDGLPGRTLVIRPGLIVGPFDPTDRFTSWVVRADRGGEMLAPEPTTTPVQSIDARDLAAFTLSLVEQGTTGAFEAVGPNEELTVEHLVEACVAASGKGTKVTWIPWSFLAEREVAPWMELGAWVPDDGDSKGLNRVDASKAKAAGLVTRPIEETVADTLAWYRTLPADRSPRAGLAAEKEQKILEEWHASQR